MEDVTSASAVPGSGVVVQLSQPGHGIARAGPVSLAEAVETFLSDLARAGRSPATARAYKSDLTALTDVCIGAVDAVTVAQLRDALLTCQALAPATRARRQAAFASFWAWLQREGLTEHNPTIRLQPVKLPAPLPRAMPRAQIDAVLGAIPASRLRDRTIFGLLDTTGARVGEVLGVHVGDFSLKPGDERLRVLGKGGRERSLLLDDPRLLILLRRHLRTLGRTSGPVFTAERGDRLTPLTYEAIRQRWQSYCQSAGVTGSSIHTLRHAHAVALIDGGVRVETVRKRLGHSHLASTERYARLSDRVADDELRAWRRAQK